MIAYGFSKTTERSFDETIEMIIEELKKEGFGVLTRINVKDKLESKLGIEFQRYEILGACNPAMAYKAISAEENIGLMLPCNVIVYQKDRATNISIIKPTAAMGMIENKTLKEVAEEVENKLKNVFNAID